MSSTPLGHAPGQGTVNSDPVCSWTPWLTSRTLMSFCLSQFTKRKGWFLPQEGTETCFLRWDGRCREAIIQIQKMPPTFLISSGKSSSLVLCQPTTPESEVLEASCPATAGNPFGCKRAVILITPQAEASCEPIPEA